MPAFLPPLRLTGAQILRNGSFQRRSLAFARGRITKGPLPAVDLSGYLILPGIIDLHCRTPLPDTDLEHSVHALAYCGVTTAWVVMEWPETADAEDQAEAFLQHTGRMRAKTGMDLRAKLVFSSNSQVSPDVLHHLEGLGLDFVSFIASPPIAKRTELSEIGRILDTSPPGYPRHLCQMAETFDLLGITYGSLGDGDAETREYYRMLGARIAQMPRRRAAAATAFAMHDPVLAPAANLSPNAATDEAVGTAQLVAEGLCTGIVSNGYPDAMAQAAWVLSGNDLEALAKTWQLLSTGPAEIMGLADRAHLEIGKRADLAIVNPETRRVEATISKGCLIHASGEAQARFFNGQQIKAPLAAE